MKIKNLFNCMIALAVSFSAVSCSDDDDPKAGENGPNDGLPAHRMFILNEGSYALNNSGIAFYAPDNSGVALIPDIFFKQNDEHLGDTGQDIIEYDDNIYVSVFGSNYIAKLSPACVEEARLSFAGDADFNGGIRYLAAKDGYVYASFHGGMIAKINAATLKVEGKLHATDTNLEGIAIEGDNLYVSNSYTQVDGSFIYHNEVLVVDLATFTLRTPVRVASNPNDLIEAEDKLFLISNDYSRESYVFQLIDPSAGNRVSELGYATEMAAGNGMVYLVDSRSDYSAWPQVTTVNSFSYYDIKSGRLNNTSFLKNAPAELTNASIYMIKVDDESGDIYIGVTHYIESNGDMYRFSKDGTFIEKFDCGGQNPKSAAFLD